MKEQIRRTGVSKETRFSSRPPVKKAFTLHAVFARASLLALHDVKMKEKKKKNVRYAFKPHTEVLLTQQECNVLYQVKHHVIAISQEERKEKGCMICGQPQNHAVQQTLRTQSVSGRLNYESGVTHTSTLTSPSLCYSSLFGLCTHKCTWSECSHETARFFLKSG